MQALQDTIQQIRQQLASLSPTARMLVAALMIILVMTLILVAQYSSRTSLEPLGLKANLNPEARARAISHIEGRGISYRERGGEILVPADQRYSILAQLTDGDVITPDQINFDSLIESDSPFLSRSQNDRRWLIATMNVLSHTISGMSGVQRATVVIDEPRNPGGIGRAHMSASASVTVMTRGGESLSQGQVDAIASMVAGAHANLTPRNVVVTDATGRVHRVRSDDAFNATTNLELQQTQERLLREKIRESLGYIAGVNVAVHATVDTREIIQNRRNFEDPKLGITGESTRTTSSSNELGGREAGVRPNTGANIGTSSRRGSSMSDERTNASMIPAFGGTDAKITDSRGFAIQMNATVGVPRSYFVRLYQSEQNDETAQPEPGELAQLIADETDRIRAQIEPLIDTRAVDGAVAGTVMVSMIPDFAMSSLIGTDGAALGADSGVVGLVMNEGMVRYLGLGALVLVSLAMMFMLVRKATIPRELPTDDELAGKALVFNDQDADMVGEAAETSSSMEGLEVDEQDLRRAQMLTQINDMARSNPDEIASLVRRWIKAEM